jgi:hypothetical protein
MVAFCTFNYFYLFSSSFCSLLAPYIEPLAIIPYPSNTNPIPVSVNFILALSSKAYQKYYCQSCVSCYFRALASCSLLPKSYLCPSHIV